MSISTGIVSVFEFLAAHPYSLIGSALIFVIWSIVSTYVAGGNKGNNPFSKDYRTSPRPFVHDAKSRDAILKQRFKANLVPESLDVVIIGSGVGGLTAGVLLSRAGLKVLVLEQHDQAGGCCHTFVEKGFEFDTGIHYVGNLGSASHHRVLLDQLSCGQLRWSQMDDEFDTVAVGEPATAKFFKMKSGDEHYFQNLMNLFPKEKDAILKYKDLAKDAADSFMGIVMLKLLPRALVRFLVVTGLYRVVFACYRKGYTERTLQTVLDELTDNKELKVVLSYLNGDYGVAPKAVPFLLHAVMLRHFKEGCYYPSAGASEIPFHMIQSIQKDGGRVLVQAPVRKILCDGDGRVIGVIAGKNEVEIRARYIISDAGVVNTFTSLLPKDVARASWVYPLIQRVGQNYSFMTTFLGIEGSSKELKLPAGNVWHFNTDDINKTMDEYFNLKAEDIQDAKFPMSGISFPSAKDPEWNAKYPGKSSIIVLTPAKWEWFEEWKDEKLRHRGDRYDAIKDAIGQQIWQQCVDLFPQLEGKKIYMEVGTPLSNQHYLATPRGEMYGLDHNVSRFTVDTVSKLRPDTDIPGLYLTGQDTLMCGFIPSMMMGMICASRVLNRNLYKDLLKFTKQTIQKESPIKNGHLKKLD